MQKTLRQFIALILIPCIWVQACRKPALEDQKKELINGQITLDMNIEDIYAALPQTMFYNLSKDGLQFYVGRAQWNKGTDYIIARIPTTQGNNAYIYAVKKLQDPKIKTFAVQYIPAANSSPSSFTGRQMWVDFQNWHAYGVQFSQGQVVSHLEPTRIVDLGWESCAMGEGNFVVNASGKIIIKGTTAGKTANRPTGGPDDMGCTDPNGGPSLWEGIGGFFRKVGEGIGNIIEGIGNWFDDLPPGDGGGGFPGGGWNPGFPPPPPGGGGSPPGGGGYTPPPSPDPDPSYPPFWNGKYSDVSHVYWEDLTATTVPGGPPPPSPIYADGSRVTGIGSVYSIADEDAMLVRSMLGITSTEYSWLVSHHRECTEIRDYLISVPDLTADEKKAIALEHLQLMMTNTDYFEYIHDYMGHWWDPDTDGFTYSKKKQMEIYVELKPFGLLDCTDLALNEWNDWQVVGSYAVPTSVTTRISTIISEHAPVYTTSNFFIQKIGDAHGPVVNCDVFKVHITTLPKKSSGVRMTSEEFLEYFRNSIQYFDGMGDDVATSFGAYYDALPDPDFSDAAQFAQPYEASLGALGSFHMPIPAFPIMHDDGTIIESGYSRTTSHKWFMFTTMTSPADGDHPVAGNRRFGIFPDSENGGYCFYLRGVDRVWSFESSTLNTWTDMIFSGADDLWGSIQSGIINHINTSSGSASYYPGAHETSRRPLWEGPVKDFLTGKITLIKLRELLNCLD